jgi:flagellar hook-basal body complex protein FliE
MSDIRIGSLPPSPDIFKPIPEVGQPPRKDGASFGKMVKGIVEDAVKAEEDAGKSIQDFASGNMNDVHDVIMAVGKANMAISLLVQVRNGILDAYNQLSKIAG